MTEKSWYDVCSDYSLEVMDESPKLKDISGMQCQIDKFGGAVYYDSLEEGAIFYLGAKGLNGCYLEEMEKV